MKSWPTKPLTEVAAVIRGVSFDKSQVSDEPRKDSVPVLRAGNIQRSLLTDSDLVYVSDKQVSDEQRMRRGDLAICMSSGSPTIVGKSAYLDTDWNGSVGAFCAIVRFSEKLHHRFGAYWFRSPAFMQWRDNNAKGANIQNLRRTELEALSIPVPPMAEQERIVKLLDEADELQKLRAQADRRAATFISALFHEKFGDATNSYNSWPIVKIGDICEVKGGKRLPKGDEYSEEPTPFRYIRVSDIHEGWIDETGLRFLKPETQQQISRYTVKTGDLIITIAGTIGVIAPVTPSLDGANLTENAAKLVPRHSDKFDAVFLSELMQTSSVQKQIGLRTGQVTIGKLALFRIEQLSFPLPPLPLQKEFAHRVTEIRELKASQATSRTRLDALFQSMSHRAFNREL